MQVCQYAARCKAVLDAEIPETGNQKWKGGEQMQAGTAGAQYAGDKPKSCDYCYFQSPVKGTCGLDECFYLLPEMEPGSVGEGCACCPYGRDRPCIGFCMQKLLTEMKAKKSGEGGFAGAG